MLLMKAWSKCIKQGALTVTDAHGKRHEIGDGTGAPVALTLHDPSLHWKLLLRARREFSEAYIDKRVTFEQGGVFEMMDLMGRNLSSGAREPIAVRLFEKLEFLAKPFEQMNFIRKSKENAEYHYDISDKFYELFLDSNMQYTCGYFTEDHNDLERAQRDKMQHLAAKLLLKPGDKVLDIGCGWGGLACTLAKETGCRVTGVTLSQVQLDHAKERAKREGAEHLFNPVLEDYRRHKGKYDRVIVVGMMEHVGLHFLDKFMSCIRDFLKDDGVALIHCVTRLKGPALSDAHVRKYIFRGSYTPALSEITPRIERNGLMLADVEIWRIHYARTLRLWRERFMARADEAAAMYDERLVRIFEYYLAICEAGFIHQGLAVMHLQMSKKIDAVPRTRDYITEYKFPGAKAAA